MLWKLTPPPPVFFYFSFQRREEGGREGPFRGRLGSHAPLVKDQFLSGTAATLRDRLTSLAAAVLLCKASKLVRPEHFLTQINSLG